MVNLVEVPGTTNASPLQGAPNTPKALLRDSPESLWKLSLETLVSDMSKLPGIPTSAASVPGNNQ